MRDTLRVDDALRKEYGAVKKSVGSVAANIDTYGQAKTPIVQKILAAAGLLDEAELASIASNQVPSHNELHR